MIWSGVCYMYRRCVVAEVEMGRGRGVVVGLMSDQEFRC